MNQFLRFKKYIEEDQCKFVNKITDNLTLSILFYINANLKNKTSEYLLLKENVEIANKIHTVEYMDGKTEILEQDLLNKIESSW